MAGMKRRANHEGMIRLRPDGRWEARVSLSNGRTKSFYAREQRDLISRLNTLKRDLQKGLPVPPERLTLDQFLTDWLENHVKPSVRPRTYESYAATVKLHISPSLGRARLSSLEPSAIQRLLKAKSAEGLSVTSVRYIL